jgi:hypothetical protein
MFTGMLVFTTSLLGPIFAAIVASGLALVAWLLQKLMPRLRQFGIRHLLLATTAVACLLGLARLVPELQEALIGTAQMIGLLIIGAAPTLAFLSFSRASAAAFHIRARQGTSARAVPLVTTVALWLAGFWMTWKWALESMMVEYSKLPTTNPNCFVSSSAACGHRWLVKSTALPGGQLVNRQMKRLKFLEFALAAVFPTLHSVVRGIYDHLGPPLASICRRNVWIADATYLALKPVEQLAVLVQRLMAIHPGDIDRIYGATVQGLGQPDCHEKHEKAQE